MAETWLTSSHNNNEFLSDKYRVFRKDQHQTNIKAKKGDHVLIAVLAEVDCDE